MKRHKIIVVALGLLLLAGGAYAAGYIKFDGVEGESSSNTRPAEEVTFNYDKISFNSIAARVGGPLTILDERGMRRVLDRDGVYSTSKGEKVWVKNGIVARSTVVGGAQDLNSGETAQPTGLLVPAVQKARGDITLPAEEKGKKKGNVEYGWKVEEGTK